MRREDDERVDLDKLLGIGLYVVLLTLVAWLLFGCSAFERKVDYVPYEVKVPVPVPCAAATPAEPDWATRPLRAADEIDVKVDALLAERRQRLGYEAQLRAATEGCR